MVIFSLNFTRGCCSEYSPPTNGVAKLVFSVLSVYLFTGGPPRKFKLQIGPHCTWTSLPPSPDMFKLVQYVSRTVAKGGWMAVVVIILNTLLVK